MLASRWYSGLPYWRYSRSRMCRVAGPLRGVVGLIHGGQQFDIRPRVALRKAMAAIDDRPELALLAIALDQPRHLRAAQASHAGDVAAQQPTPLAAWLLVLLLLEQLLDPVIDLLPALGFEPDLLAGL